MTDSPARKKYIAAASENPFVASVYPSTQKLPISMPLEAPLRIYVRLLAVFRVAKDDDHLVRADC